MSYLFIDKWADFSDLNDNTRENAISPIFLMYTSVLRDHNNKVHYINWNDNELTKSKLLEFIENNKIETIIFHVNIDNISSVSNFKLSCLDDKIDYVFLVDDKNLIHETIDKKVKIIFFDEKLDIKDNLTIFLENFGIIVNVETLEKCMIDYTFERIIKKKTVLINIGSGCKAQCNFCNIANSVPKYRSINIIMKEIISVLDRGVKYFHVSNHSFSCDREFMKLFCERLIDLTYSYDFIWSCYIIPSYFINNIDLLPLMKKANLKKIELGCETGSALLQDKMNIQHSNANIEKIVTASIEANICMFSAHFILGSPKENMKSLVETKEFILDLINLTNSFCDICLHCYYPEIGNDNNVFNRMTNKKNDFVCPSESLSIENLNAQRRIIFTAIRSKMNELLCKTHLKEQYELFKLEKKYGVNLQILRDYYSKTRFYSSFLRKETIKQAFYSWEIPDERLDYTLIYNYGTFVVPEDLKADCSNFALVLENYIRSGYNVGKIVDIIEKETNGRVTKDVVYSAMDQLEEHLGLYYIKYLN